MFYSCNSTFGTQLTKALVTILFYLLIYYVMNFGYYKAIRPTLVELDSYSYNQSKRLIHMYGQYGLVDVKEEEKKLKKDTKAMKMIEVMDKAFLIKPDHKGEIKIANLFNY